jgi:CO dehydrogenase/acetyl-CoA synthase delta subunit
MSDEMSDQPASMRRVFEIEDDDKPVKRMVTFDPDDPEIQERLILEAHRAICEDSYEECVEWRGRCVKSFEAMLSALKASG